MMINFTFCFFKFSTFNFNLIRYFRPPPHTYVTAWIHSMWSENSIVNIIMNHTCNTKIIHYIICFKWLRIWLMSDIFRDIFFCIEDYKLVRSVYKLGLNECFGFLFVSTFVSVFPHGLWCTNVFKEGDAWTIVSG